MTYVLGELKQFVDLSFFHLMTYVLGELSVDHKIDWECNVSYMLTFQYRSWIPEGHH